MRMPPAIFGGQTVNNTLNSKQYIKKQKHMATHNSRIGSSAKKVNKKFESNQPKLTSGKK